MKKRKIIVILLALSMVLSTFFGCATENDQGSNTNAALDGNASQNTTSTAFSSGIGNTSSSFDETAYVGTWSTAGTNWINGGMILDISVSGDNVVCKFYCYEQAPECYVASFSCAVHYSVIVDNQADLFFSDDGWGNTGSVTVSFKTNEIVLAFSDVHDSEGLGLEGMWGFRNGSYTLTYAPNAMDEVTYTMDEYYELFPEYDPDHNPTPDSSPTFLYTHSGTISISAANISLQDSAVLYIAVSFAGSVSYDCDQSDVITLSWGQFDSSNTVPLYITANQNGTAQIRIYETNYPDNYLTVNVTVSGHASVDTSTASGILASMGMTEEQFRAYCQPLKRDIASNNSTIICDLRDYPANYVGGCYRFVTTLGNQLEIEISQKGQSSDGYIIYISDPNEDWQGYILLFDMRDDTYSPTISAGDKIYPYMIFTGVETINGIDYVCFWLISVDKC